MISREYYRDFLGTIKGRLAEVNEELEWYENWLNAKRDKDDWCDYWIEVHPDMENLMHNMSYYEHLEAYFKDESEWTEWDSLEHLKWFVEEIDKYSKELYAKTLEYLPVDGGELVGISDEDWDLHEGHRYEVDNAVRAWRGFVEFCEFGEV